MKILLDHCVPKRLGRHLTGHTVSTTRQMRWENLQNGKLLAAAAPHFDLLLTVDKGFEHQHNLDALPVSVVLLVAQTNQLSDLLPLIPDLLSALQTLTPHALLKVGEKPQSPVLGPAVVARKGRPGPLQEAHAATIEWIRLVDGGRTAPPSTSPGGVYTAPGRVGEWNGKLASEANWSIVVTLVEAPDELHWNARIRYLVDDAPHHLLTLGAKFELYEGRRCVARGIIN